MLELLFCSMLTILPDYLFRRFVQGKRFGKEITLYSVWFELRWGITTCLILTTLLILTVFYNHPATSSVTLFYRTIPILPEIPGRVAEVNVDYSAHVEKGAPLFKLDSSKQEAAVETARRKIAEVDADMVVAQVDLTKAEHQIDEAKSKLPAGGRRTGDQNGAAKAQLRNRPGARDRAAAGSRPRPHGHGQRSDGCKGLRAAETSDTAAVRQSERRG